MNLNCRPLLNKHAGTCGSHSVLRQGLERVEKGHAIAVPFDTEPSTDELLDRYFVMGTPETCIAKIKQLRAVMGIDHFNASFWFGDLGHDQVINSMTLFAEEVLPVLKSDDMRGPPHAKEMDAAE